MRDFNRNGKSDVHDRYIFHKNFETRMDVLKKMDEPSLHIDTDQESLGWGQILIGWGILILVIVVLSALGVV